MMGGEGGKQTETGLLELDTADPDLEYTRSVVFGVFENMTELDDAVSVNLVGWTLDRLAKVDLAILRVACWEIMCQPNIPIGVSVEEAAELAHRFSTPESVPFITGVLSSVARDYESKDDGKKYDEDGDEDEDE
jgi:N utilization substance protein B